MRARWRARVHRRGRPGPLTRRGALLAFSGPQRSYTIHKMSSPARQRSAATWTAGPFRRSDRPQLGAASEEADAVDDAAGDGLTEPGDRAAERLALAHALDERAQDVGDRDGCLSQRRPAGRRARPPAENRE